MLLEFARNFGQTVLNRLLEIGELLVVLRVEALLFDKFPEAFNQVQVRRIRWQKEQLNPQFVGDGLNKTAALVTSIV